MRASSLVWRRRGRLRVIGIKRAAGCPGTRAKDGCGASVWGAPRRAARVRDTGRPPRAGRSTNLATGFRHNAYAPPLMSTAPLKPACRIPTNGDSAVMHDRAIPPAAVAHTQSKHHARRARRYRWQAPQARWAPHGSVARGRDGGFRKATLRRGPTGRREFRCARPIRQRRAWRSSSTIALKQDMKSRSQSTCAASRNQRMTVQPCATSRFHPPSDRACPCR